MIDVDLTDFDSGPQDVERCGVIFQRPDGKWYVVEVPNRAQDPSSGFIIWAGDVETLGVPEDHVLVGPVHTHPARNAMMPSNHDLSAIPVGYVGLVYHPASASRVWYSSRGIIELDLRRRHGKPGES